MGRLRYDKLELWVVNQLGVARAKESGYTDDASYYLYSA